MFDKAVLKELSALQRAVEKLEDKLEHMERMAAVRDENVRGRIDRLDAKKSVNPPPMQLFPEEQEERERGRTINQRIRQFHGDAPLSEEEIEAAKKRAEGMSATN